MFGLSYAFRFAYDRYLYYYIFNGSDMDLSFNLYICTDALVYTEGLCFMALLLIHRKNFKVHRPILNDENQDESVYSYSNSINDNETLVHLARSSHLPSSSLSEHNDETVAFEMDY